MYELFGLINDGNIPKIISLGGEIYNLDYSKKEIAYKSRNTGFWLNYSWYVEQPKRLNTKLYILEK